MADFFNCSFSEQVKEIIKYGDLKLLQAFIGIRSPIALLQYCATFLITPVSIAQAKYQAYDALSYVLYHYSNKDVTTDDDINKNIEIQINRYRKELCSKLFLPSVANSNLKSLTQGQNFVDLESFAQWTDIASLSTLDYKKVIEIYNTYVSDDEKERLVLSLKRTREEHMEDLFKRQYLHSQCSELGYDRYKAKADEVIETYKVQLKEIKKNIFLDDWYKELLDTVINEASDNTKHILNAEIVKSQTKDSVKSKFNTVFNHEVTKRVVAKLIDDSGELDNGIGKESILQDIISFISFNNFYGKIDYDKISSKIIYRVGEILKQNNSHSSATNKILSCIVENMQPSLIPSVDRKY